MTSEGDDAIPTNTREVRQLGISQPDIWPAPNPVCVRIDYRVLRLFFKEGAAFRSNGFLRSFVKLREYFRSVSCALSHPIILCLPNPSLFRQSRRTF